MVVEVAPGDVGEVADKTRLPTGEVGDLEELQLKVPRLQALELFDVVPVEWELANLGITTYFTNTFPCNTRTASKWKILSGIQ